VTIFYSVLTTGAKMPRRGWRLISLGRPRRKPEAAVPRKQYEFARLQRRMQRCGACD